MAVLSIMLTLLSQVLADPWDITRPEQVPYDHLEPLTHTFSAKSPYVLLAPRFIDDLGKLLPLRLTLGCSSWPAIDSKGRQSAGLAPDTKLNCRVDGFKAQTYVRSWAVPGAPKMFGLMYAAYHPRVLEIYSPTEWVNHRHYWSYYVVFSRTLDGKTPYACAFWTNEVWEMHSWAFCAYNDIVTILRQGDTMNLSPKAGPEIQGLVAWEYMRQDEVVTFNAARWGPYIVCMMKDVHFNSEMTKLFHFTEQFILDGRTRYH